MLRGFHIATILFLKQIQLKERELISNLKLQSKNKWLMQV